MNDEGDQPKPVEGPADKSPGESFIVASASNYLRATLLALLALGLFDTALVLFRSPDAASLAPGYVGIAWGAGAWIALGITAFLAAIEITAGIIVGQERAPRVLDHWLRTALVSSSSALVAIVLLRPWNDLVVWPYWVAPLCALLGSGSFVFLKKRLSANHFAVLLFALAGLVFAIDATAYRRLYLSLHQLLFFIAITLSAAGFFRLTFKSPQARFAPLALAALSQLTLFSFGPEYGSLAEAQGTSTPKILSLIHLTADKDGDGHAAVFGGGDCDDSNPQVHPGACEVEGQDRNCNGHQGLTSVPPIETKLESKLDPSPDIYLFLIDTLRADFGKRARKEVAPEIDDFAKTALDFEAAYTPYPSTVPATLSMVQSRYWRNVIERHPSALETFARRGYDTRIWVGDDRHTIEEGTDILRFRAREQPVLLMKGINKAAATKAIVDEAIAETEHEEGPPRFRWLHTLDPHAPVQATGETRLEKYRNSISGVSEQFGRLVTALGQSPRGRKAIVILLADHGEEFFDHGGLYHATTVFEESLRIPLLMRIPSQTPRKIRSLASLIDVFPTLFDVLGWPRESIWRGRSLLREEQTPGTIFAQVRPPSDISGLWWSDIHAAIGTRHKLMVNLKRNLVHLYDLKADPTEQENISGENPEITEKMLRQLAEFQDRPDCRK